MKGKGITLDYRATSRDDKILTLIHFIRGFSGPVPTINDIVNNRYIGVGSTKQLEIYPTFVIYRIL